MVRTSNDSGSGPLARRGFLKKLAALGIGVATARTVLAAADERRTLSFVHTHTGEHLTATYFENGTYSSAVLQQVNVLLRDFRDGTVHVIDPHLLDRLFLLQAAVGGSEPFQVISGYRSPTTNAALHEKSGGVAEHSLHMEGQAIDVRLSGVATERLARLALQQASGGVGFYRVSDFVHVDTGRVRSWGDPVGS
jgi:uncharacterized protein YcbK (DUF882 family)